MSCKLDFAVAYCFGHSTCNSGPFLLKMWSKDAYLRGVPYGNSNRPEPVMSLRGLVGPKMHEIILLGLQDQPQYAPSYPIPIPSPRQQRFKQTKRMFRLYRSFSRFARLRALRLFNRSFRTASHCHTAGHCFYAVSFNV